MNLSAPGATLRSIGTIGLLTGVAYLASIVRDAVLAAYYGGSAPLDIYFIALAPSQFLGMEIASLAYLAFLPEFSRSLGNDDYGAVTRLLRERFALAFKGTLTVAILVTLGGLILARVLAPGYVEHGALQAVRLSFACLSVLVPMLGVMGVLRAFLEAQGRFGPWAVLPAFRSGVLSVVVVLSAVNPSIVWLILGSSLGAGAGLAYTWLTARALPSYTSARLDPRPREGNPLPTSLAPLIAALFVGQGTALLDNAFASLTGVGGVQAFALASNLLVIPQALVTGAVATVYFPVYGAHLALGKRANALSSLRRSIRLVVWGAIPVVLLFCTSLGTTVVRMIYHRGAFDNQMVLLVSQTAAGLSLGLAPYACMVLLRQYLLVADAPWLVFHAATVFFAVKWLGNWALTTSFGTPGIALSSSIAALTACAYLTSRVIWSSRSLGRVM